jgi:hypothetical protein
MSRMVRERMGRAELVQALGCDEAFVLWLEREDLVVVVEGDVYEASAIERARVCWNLHQMGVNDAGLEIALHLLETLYDERREHIRTVAWLQRQLGSRFR